MKRIFILLYLIILISTGFACERNNIAPVEKAKEKKRISEVKVAFIGDQGLGADAEAVLKLIKKENADFVLHQGDFDYYDDPAAWDEQINSVLGEDFPYFASIGNHELENWPAYQKKLKQRLARIKGADCSGDLGVNSACHFKDLFFVLSGVGTWGENHEKYLERSLKQSKANWEICSWHKNQRLMQVENKKDEVGWAAYEICRKAGAIIATGHAHTYSRTYLMNDFQNQRIASVSNILNIDYGKTFAFVSGLAGKSIRAENPELAAKPWWAKVYTKDQNAQYGALFCVFNYQGHEDKAHCYFRNISGDVIDEFYLKNEK